MNGQYFEYILKESDKVYCLDHAQRMCNGFNTYSFKEGKNQSLDVYNIGKIGEFVFYKFIKYLNKPNINIVHVPFRESYDKMNFNDDFILEINGQRIQFEIRTKGRNVPPQPNYECCTDCIKPNLVYVFLSFNKKTDTCTLLGYADWSVFSEYATVSLMNDKNSNFTHKVNEFNIQIQYLKSMDLL